MKKKEAGMGSVYLILAIFMVAVIGMVVFFNMKNNLNGGSTVEIQSGHMVKGSEAWVNFMSRTKIGRKESIKVKFLTDGGSVSHAAVIKYDKGKYTYTDKNGDTYSNRYLLDVSGREPVTEKNVRYICLADNEYSFSQMVYGEAEKGKSSKPFMVLMTLSVESMQPEQ
ncbi:hypothetical protein [Eubacterium uniforme]|uniref:Uncharacterized protein n=1 Tax=Eubacterium uniforme TaxID=39495 RepID=A0A1T4VUF1_9FIRM|nr:hypothetical protein [Eubacterium uniforme]SKA68586.1 hypothetical protein SAMN02745111_01612 [Eubacterium uniforme]HAV90041.1 hypothetical protein [Eubacterium sp.]